MANSILSGLQQNSNYLFLDDAIYKPLFVFIGVLSGLIALFLAVRILRFIAVL